MNPNYANYATGPNPEAMGGAALAVFGGIMVFLLVFFVIMYVFSAICLMKIAKKTNTPNGWFAWIPILNLILMLDIAKKPRWWAALLILFIIPMINVIAGIVWLILSIIIWMAIAKAVNKPEWMGILTVIPVVNLIIMGYLAFSKSGSIPTVTAETPPAPPIQPAV